MTLSAESFRLKWKAREVGASVEIKIAGVYLALAMTAALMGW